MASQSSDFRFASRSGEAIKPLTQILGQSALLSKQIYGGPDIGLERQVRLLGIGLFTVAIVGEIKKGKSSFLNALLGVENVLPVDTAVATSSVFKIRWGKKLRYRVYFQSEANKPKEEISVHDIARYGTEAGNPSNILKVDFISLEVPAPLLRDGLVFIDTPGLGSLHSRHRRVTLSQANKADAVIFVTDSVDSPIGAHEADFLSNLRVLGTPIMFLQTKTDLADGEAIKARIRNNVSILNEAAGFDKKSIAYFAVSSKLKVDGDASHDLDDLRESGFPNVVAFIDGCLKARRDQKHAEAAHKLADVKISALESELAAQQTRYAADSEAEQQRLAKLYESRELKVSDLQGPALKAMQRDFACQIMQLKSECAAAFSRVARPNGKLFCEYREHLLASPDAETIYGSARQLGEVAHEACCCHFQAIMENYRDRVDTLVRTTVMKAGLKVAITLEIPGVDGGKLEPLVAENLAHFADKESSDWLKTMKTVALHGGLGMGATSVIGGLVGSVVPVVGTILGSTAGTLLGGWIFAEHGVEELQQQQKDRAVGEVSSALATLFADLQQAANTEMVKIFSTIESQGTQAIAQVIEEARLAQAKQRREINEIKAASAQKLLESRKRLDALHKLLAALRESWRKVVL